jgi:hypothetical protein
MNSAFPASCAKGFALSLASLALASTAQAALLSHESFSDYNTGEIQATNPSPAVSGYTGNWTDIDYGDAEPAISTGSLSYGGANYLGSTGGKVGVAANGGGNTPQNASGRVYRVFDSSLAVTNATEGTLYMSFLFERGATAVSGNVYQTLALYDGSTADANRHFDLGSNGGGTGGATDFNFGVNNAAGTGQDYHSTGVALNTSVNLFVVKFTLGSTASGDSVTVWTNPTLGGVGDPSGGVTVSGLNLTWDRLVLSDYDDNSAAWDEIRWGTTFEGVSTAIPEPSGYALFAGAATLLGASARRPRRDPS